MKDDTYTIWPAYIDVSKTRHQGRKISRKIAIENPTVREIYLVAQAFKYEPILNSSAHYSRAWWEDPGNVKIIRALYTRQGFLTFEVEPKGNISCPTICRVLPILD